MPPPHPDLVPGRREEWFRAALDGWNRDDLEIDESWAHPDFKLYSQIMGGWVAGVDGLLKWQAEIRQQFESFEFTLERCEELTGDRLLAVGSLRFRGRESGVEMEAGVGWILTFRDGLLWRWRNYLSREEALTDAASGAAR